MHQMLTLRTQSPFSPPPSFAPHHSSGFTLELLDWVKTNARGHFSHQVDLTLLLLGNCIIKRYTFSFFIYVHILILCVHVCTCLCMWQVCSVYGGQRRAMDPLELEVQVVHVGSSAGTACALNYRSLQPCAGFKCSPL